MHGTSLPCCMHPLRLLADAAARCCQPEYISTGVYVAHPAGLALPAPAKGRSKSPSHEVQLPLRLDRAPLHPCCHNSAAAAGCRTPKRQRGQLFQCQGHGECGDGQVLFYGWGQDAPPLQLPEHAGVAVGPGTHIRSVVLQVSCRACAVLCSVALRMLRRRWRHQRLSLKTDSSQKRVVCGVVHLARGVCFLLCSHAPRLWSPPLLCLLCCQRSWTIRARTLHADALPAPPPR